MKHYLILEVAQCVWVGALLVYPFTLAAQHCPLSYGGTDSAKPNKLFLYFPTVDDATFPSYAARVSPAKAFDIVDFDSGIGTVAQLRDQIHTAVVDHYCEFNVQVFQTLTNPALLASPPARRLTVAVGSDANDIDGFYGLAQEVDTGDSLVLDYARVWGGTYQSVSGGAGGALNGANSTLDRWALSIGGTAAHEAGHTYGLAHSTTVHTGEDAFGRHLMPAGPSVTPEERAGYRRHFSDEDYGILASNVGLSVQTVHNWDFINPNGAPASQLQMDFLSTASPLTIAWSWNGPTSPWLNPTVSGNLGNIAFKGTSYHHYQVTWMAANPGFSGGAPGVVPAGRGFHVGATFTGVSFDVPDPVIITNATLLDAGGSTLPLHPRMAGYDTGTADAGDGSFRLNLFLTDLGTSLIIKDVHISQLPRVLAIDSMVRGAPMLAWDNLPVTPWTTSTCPDINLADADSCFVASLKQPRHIVKRYDKNQIRDSVNNPDGNENPNSGISIDLFPSTTVYVTATVVDPNATYWNVGLGRMVTGPLESKLYYQFAGRHPDLNRNGVDDYIDIAQGTSIDANGDGVPDESQTTAQPPLVAIGSNPEVTFYRQIRLTATASDPSGSALIYSWRSLGKGAAIIHGDSATPDVQFDEGAGVYSFEVKVTNASGLSASGVVTITYVGR